MSSEVARTGFGAVTPAGSTSKSVAAMPSQFSRQGREMAAYQKDTYVEAFKAREDYKLNAVKEFYRKLELTDRMTAVGEVDDLAIRVANGDPDRLNFFRAMIADWVTQEGELSKYRHNPKYKDLW